MTAGNPDVVIVGGGLSGLACARELQKRGISWTLLEAKDRLGGRVRTDPVEGYLLDRGFQVLQTAYSEAGRVLDLESLDLRNFERGGMFRIKGHLYTVTGELHNPKHVLGALTAPIGGIRDRYRLARLAGRVLRGKEEEIFRAPESRTLDFLRSEGFSETVIQRFFRPFFGGICLDPDLGASSRVLTYMLRVFLQGEAALPREGMGAIPRQMAQNLTEGAIRTETPVQAIDNGRVHLREGQVLEPRATVLATEEPETKRLLGLPGGRASLSETCLYFAADRARWHRPLLILNGEGAGPINNIAIPSEVSPAYAPAGKSLIAVILLGNPKEEDDDRLLDRVRAQLREWFGLEVDTWRHLATYRISHALLDQSPPTIDPHQPKQTIRPGIFAAGEHGSLAGIQWALLSGRRAAEATSEYLVNRSPGF